MKKLTALLAALSFMLFSCGLAVPVNAYATCVPHSAYDEVVHHPAVTKVVHHAAVPGHWWNWSPNHNKGPFNGPPAFPSDPRGTWHEHSKGGPRQDQVGTFQTGKPGHGDWFHREAGKAAYDETVVVKPAYDTKTHHDAVVCSTPTPTPTGNPKPTPHPTKTPHPTSHPTPTVVPSPSVTPSNPVTSTHKAVAKPRELPNTGGPVWWIAGFGLALLILGALIVALDRRRHLV